MVKQPSSREGVLGWEDVKRALVGRFLISIGEHGESIGEENEVVDEEEGTFEVSSTLEDVISWRVWVMRVSLNGASVPPSHGYTVFVLRDFLCRNFGERRPRLFWL